MSVDTCGLHASMRAPEGARSTHSSHPLSSSVHPVAAPVHRKAFFQRAERLAQAITEEEDDHLLPYYSDAATISALSSGSSLSAAVPPISRHHKRYLQQDATRHGSAAAAADRCIAANIQRNDSDSHLISRRIRQKLASTDAAIDGDLGTDGERNPANVSALDASMYADESSGHKVGSAACRVPSSSPPIAVPSLSLRPSASINIANTLSPTEMDVDVPETPNVVETFHESSQWQPQSQPFSAAASMLPPLLSILPLHSLSAQLSQTPPVFTLPASLPAARANGEQSGELDDLVASSISTHLPPSMSFAPSSDAGSQDPVADESALQVAAPTLALPLPSQYSSQHPPAQQLRFSEPAASQASASSTRPYRHQGDSPALTSASAAASSAVGSSVPDVELPSQLLGASTLLPASSSSLHQHRKPSLIASQTGAISIPYSAASALSASQQPSLEHPKGTAEAAGTFPPAADEQLKFDQWDLLYPFVLHRSANLAAASSASALNSTLFGVVKDAVPWIGKIEVLMEAMLESKTHSLSFTHVSTRTEGELCGWVWFASSLSYST